MRNFLKIASGVSVAPLLLALVRQPHLWNQHTLRTTHPGTPHTQVDDIWLRFNALPEPGDEARIMDEHESITYPALDVLPEARGLMMQVFAAVAGERLGRALITRLKPGGHIAPHADGGSHAAYYDRFHLVLQSNERCVFRAGKEVVQMRTGEVWWFDNSQEHEVANQGDDDRIHLIVDARCLQPEAAMPVTVVPPSTAKFNLPLPEWVSPPVAA